ncbi:hypothetical protein ABZ949_14635 [Micromonospora tulbaghiae]|uniref:hypothetical protein n=1 Tax=Micromonospora tulbaghiae TaxID=479978 RepID=UPI0033CF7C73
MTQPIVISVAKPLWTAWAVDRKLRNPGRQELAQLTTDQLLDTLSIHQELAADTEAEVVYGLWMKDADSYAHPIVKHGMASTGDFYLFGETPEEALENANRFRERSLNAIKEELARRAADRR